MPVTPFYTFRVLSFLAVPMVLLVFSLLLLYAGLLFPFFLESFFITAFGLMFFILTLISFPLFMYLAATKAAKGGN